MDWSDGYEVNENKNFARLRQVYNSLILATWYKKKIKDSILEQVYADKNKVAGVNISDPQEKEKIYQRYLRAFKKGVYNYIKEEIDPATQETIPRKYFSGGVVLNFAMNSNKTDMAMNHSALKFTSDPSQITEDLSIDHDVLVEAGVAASNINSTFNPFTEKHALPLSEVLLNRETGMQESLESDLKNGVDIFAVSDIPLPISWGAHTGSRKTAKIVEVSDRLLLGARHTFFVIYNNGTLEKIYLLLDNRFAVNIGVKANFKGIIENLDMLRFEFEVNAVKQRIAKEENGPEGTAWQQAASQRQRELKNEYGDILIPISSNSNLFNKFYSTNHVFENLVNFLGEGYFLHMADDVLYFPEGGFKRNAWGEYQAAGLEEGREKAGEEIITNLTDMFVSRIKQRNISAANGHASKFTVGGIALANVGKGIPGIVAFNPNISQQGDGRVLNVWTHELTHLACDRLKDSAKAVVDAIIARHKEFSENILMGKEASLELKVEDVQSLVEIGLLPEGSVKDYYQWDHAAAMRPNKLDDKTPRVRGNKDNAQLSIVLNQLKDVLNKARHGDWKEDQFLEIETRDDLRNALEQLVRALKEESSISLKEEVFSTLLELLVSFPGDINEIFNKGEGAGTGSVMDVLQSFVEHLESKLDFRRAKKIAFETLNKIADSELTHKSLEKFKDLGIPIVIKPLKNLNQIKLIQTAIGWKEIEISIFKSENQEESVVVLTPGTSTSSGDTFRDLASEHGHTHMFAVPIKPSEPDIRRATGLHEVMSLFILAVDRSADELRMVYFDGQKWVPLNTQTDVEKKLKQYGLIQRGKKKQNTQAKQIRIRGGNRGDQAQVTKLERNGGIDFTANRTPLEIQNGGQGIKFHLDPAMLVQLKNAPGFVPVIINIQPMTNLRTFLGLDK